MEMKMHLIDGNVIFGFLVIGIITGFIVGGYRRGQGYGRAGNAMIGSSNCAPVQPTDSASPPPTST